MTGRASDFLQAWTATNVVAVPAVQRVSEAGLLAFSCKDAAAEIGIREPELIAAAGGDLDSFMIEAMASPAALARSEDDLSRDD